MSQLFGDFCRFDKGFSGEAQKQHSSEQDGTNVFRAFFWKSKPADLATRKVGGGGGAIPLALLHKARLPMRDRTGAVSLQRLVFKLSARVKYASFLPFLFAITKQLQWRKLRSRATRRRGSSGTRRRVRRRSQRSCSTSSSRRRWPAGRTEATRGRSCTSTRCGAGRDLGTRASPPPLSTSWWSTCRESWKSSLEHLRRQSSHGHMFWSPCQECGQRVPANSTVCRDVVRTDYALSPAQIEKSPPLWGRDNEGGKASDWSRIQNPAFWLV